MGDVSFLSAFFGGLLTFLAPCTLPLIPGYLAFIGGVGGDTAERGRVALKLRILTNALFFVLGFSLVFMLFGMASGAFGKFLVLYKTELVQLSGFIILYFALTLLDLLPLPRLGTNGMFGRLFGRRMSGTPSGSFLLGFFFAFGWSPCLGPILGTILLLAATGGTIFYGGLLLFTYALGLALPFLVVAFLYGSTFRYVERLEPYLRFTKIAGGILLLFVGTLLVIGQFGILNTWMGKFLDVRLLDIMLLYT